MRKADGGEAVSDGWTDYEGKYLLLDYEPAQYELAVTDEGQGLGATYRLDATAGGGLTAHFVWPPVPAK